MTSTPKWWAPVWTKNPASRRIRELAFTRYTDPLVTAVRASTDAPWRVIQANTAAPAYLRPLADFVAALPEAERARLEVGPIAYREKILALLGRSRDLA